MYTKLNDLLQKCDGVLLTSPHNMRYFSGFSGGEGAVWCSADSRIVFTDSRYVEQAACEAEGFDIREANNWLAEICSLKNIKTIGIEDSYLPTSTYLSLIDKLSGVKICPASKEVELLRAVKTDTELEIMKKAEDICCRAFERILDFIRPGISEKILAAQLEYYIRQEGGDGFAFETIAISGARCSLPHGTPSDKLIEKGDFVTMDFGAVVDGYCSDMTRTVIVGKATDEQRKIYNIVKTAQQTGLDFIKAGVLGRNADKAARDIIETSGYGKHFRHSLGHGVGLLVHEMPNLSPKSEAVLTENMVVTCEPGIYIPDFGGVRIEDMVCVKNDGITNFTHSTKDLIEIF